jgi:hypothetical protein
LIVIGLASVYSFLYYPRQDMRLGTDSVVRLMH